MADNQWKYNHIYELTYDVFLINVSKLFHENEEEQNLFQRSSIKHYSEECLSLKYMFFLKKFNPYNMGLKITTNITTISKIVGISL